MKYTLVIALFAFLGFGTAAQTIENVNLLNTNGLYGSPRYVGMGGSFMALGNDLSVLSINPAAAAVFRNDNFGLTLGFQGQTNTSTFLNSTQDKNTLDVLLENLGWVKKFGPQGRYAFSISYTKLADYNTTFDVTGVNRYNSSGNLETGFTLGEYWLGAAYGYTVNELASAGLLEEASAASADILYREEDSTGNFRVVAFDYVDNEAITEYQYTESGSRNSININFGGQASQSFYWGAGIGIPVLNYVNRTSLIESGYADSSYFNDIQLDRNNSVDAVGINLNAGFIYRPVQAFRIGASYQSPTWHSVNEVYTMQTTGYGRDGTVLAGNEYIFDDISYGATTPAIYRLGLAGVIGKHAIITTDFEYSDPSKTTLNGKNNNNYELDEVRYQDSTTATYAVKLGGELRFGPGYARAGYQYRTSNFQNEDNFRTGSTSISGGLGFKKGSFGIDLAYVVTTYSQNYLSHPYLAYAVDNGAGIEDFNTDRAIVQNDVSIGRLVLGVNWSF